MRIPDHLYITKNKYFVLLLVELFDLVLISCGSLRLRARSP